MIVVENLAVRNGAFALRDLSFTVPPGAHGVLMGRTGSGKTTILEAICGLKPLTTGRIVLGDREVTWLKPAFRGVGYVPQDGALFPHLTVREHLAFALRIRRWEAVATARRVAELAEMLALQPLLHRRPAGLSGGEAQRVALGRALANHSPVLCLDEPLSALDDATRAEMCEVLQTVRRHTGVTILHVTHNLADAHRLADRIYLLKEGRLSLLGREPAA
jgi:ABC-type sugar transport system ATPase subunit